MHKQKVKIEIYCAIMDKYLKLGGLDLSSVGTPDCQLGKEHNRFKRPQYLGEKTRSRGGLPVQFQLYYWVVEDKNWTKKETDFIQAVIINKIPEVGA